MYREWSLHERNWIPPFSVRHFRFCFVFRLPKLTSSYQLEISLHKISVLLISWGRKIEQISCRIVKPLMLNFSLQHINFICAYIELEHQNLENSQLSHDLSAFLQLTCSLVWNFYSNVRLPTLEMQLMHAAIIISNCEFTFQPCSYMPVDIACSNEAI